MPVFLPGKFYEQRGLEDYSPRNEESDWTLQRNTRHRTVQMSQAASRQEKAAGPQQTASHNTGIKESPFEFITRKSIKTLSYF